MAAVSMSSTNKDKPVDRFIFSAINPMTDGPVRKPIKPPVVTIAKPSTALTPGIVVAALNNTGTMQQQPNPIKTYPAIAMGTAGVNTTIKKPVAANSAPVITTPEFGNNIVPIESSNCHGSREACIAQAHNFLCTM